MEHKLLRANDVAEIVHKEYGFRYEKCIDIVLSCPWFMSDRVTLPNADAILDEVHEYIRKHD